MGNNNQREFVPRLHEATANLEKWSWHPFAWGVAHALYLETNESRAKVPKQLERELSWDHSEPREFLKYSNNPPSCVAFKCIVKSLFQRLHKHRFDCDKTGRFTLSPCYVRWKTFPRTLLRSTCKHPAMISFALSSADLRALQQINWIFVHVISTSMGGTLGRKYIWP